MGSIDVCLEIKGGKILEIPDTCSVKGEWMEHGIEYHNVREANNV